MVRINLFLKAVPHYLVVAIFIFLSSLSLSAQTIQKPLSFILLDTVDVNYYCGISVLHYPLATDTIDAFDAKYYGPLDNLGMYSYISNKKFVGNATSEFINDKIIPLGITLYASKTSGKYNFWAADVSGYTGCSMVLLIDSLTNPPSVYNLKTTSKVPYSFTPFTTIEKRFYLKLCPSAYSFIEKCGNETKLTLRNPSSQAVKYKLIRISDSYMVASNNNFVGDTILPNLTHGNYSLSFTNEQNQQIIDTIKIPTPTTVNIIPNDTVLDINSSIIDFTSNVTNYAGTLKYKWNFGDSTAIDTLFSTTHSFTKMGKYKVVLTVELNGGCSVSDSITVEVTNLTSLQNSSSNLRVYVQNKVICINGKTNATSFSVYDVSGKCINQFQLEKNKLNQQFKLDGITEGIYFIKYMDNTSFNVQKIFIDSE